MKKKKVIITTIFCSLAVWICFFSPFAKPTSVEAKGDFSITKVASKDRYNVFVIDDEETGNSYIAFSYLSPANGKVSVSITPRLAGQDYYHK